MGHKHEQNHLAIKNTSCIQITAMLPNSKGTHIDIEFQRLQLPTSYILPLSIPPSLSPSLPLSFFPFRNNHDDIITMTQWTDVSMDYRTIMTRQPTTQNIKNTNEHHYLFMLNLTPLPLIIYVRLRYVP